MTHILSHEVDPAGIKLSLPRESRGFFSRPYAKTSIPPQEWTTVDEGRMALAIGALFAFEELNPGNISEYEDHMLMSHGAAASLSEAVARSLGLPEVVPYSLHVETTGALARPGFGVKGKWLDGGAPIMAQRAGSVLTTAAGEFRIPAPIYSILNAIDKFAAIENPTSDECWDVLGTIKSYLDEPRADTDDTETAAQPDIGSRQIVIEEFIQGIKVYAAAHFSLEINNRPDGSVDFDAVPFAKEISDQRGAGAEISETNGILPEDLLSAFQSGAQTGFRQFQNAKSTYLLGPGQYLILDQNLLPALQVVRQKQKAGAQERKQFARNPIPELVESYKNADVSVDGELSEDSQDEAIEQIINDLFIETIEYSERVIGLGIWRPPVLPYVENIKNPWEPETFGIRIGNVYVPLKESEIPTLRQTVNSAIEAGEPSTIFKGETIPATAETVEVLDKLIGLMHPKERGEDESPSTDKVEKLQFAMQIKENFDEETFAPIYQSRASGIPLDVPREVETPLLDHQLEAFEWMVAAYQTGYPGVLNADDQGLGKTLQAIAFLAWLRTFLKTQPADEQKPFLIVAPTSLLRNWIQEIELHMDAAGLGLRIDAFGSGLKDLKRGDQDGYDINDDSTTSRLDLGLLQTTPEQGAPYWVLTTYTTLMNFQQSFAEVPFAAVVFDEIQNIKNPASLRHRAAKSVNADFRFGLTGTPIENSLTDLWSVMDSLSPGRLGALKEYSARYKNADHTALKELHTRIFAGSAKVPALGIRRMKADEIAGLPRKNYRLYPEFMPEAQAAAYDAVFHQLADAAKGRALKMLHLLRSVSLHPDHVEQAGGENLDTYVLRSARLKMAMEIIDDIRSSEERALVFIESIEMQHAFRQLLKARYGLTDIRIINGATPPDKRMIFVNEFQEKGGAHPGFNVMILGPRAAGVGLTLTAATHVIHLSRWWNPAVEEQCNDRIYRIGQDRDVTVHLPMAIHDAYKERSFDCILNNIMQRKRRLSRNTLFPPVNETGDVSLFMEGLYDTETAVLAEIDNGTWQDFENWIIKRMHDSGNWNAYKTPLSGDKGADGIFTHKERNQSVIVQVKHRQDPNSEMDAAPVHQVLHAKDHYEVNDPVLVALTNATSFSQIARNEAQKHGVILVDRARLCLWPNHIIV